MKNLENRKSPANSTNTINPTRSEKLSLRGNNILTKTISIVFLILLVLGLFAFIIYGLYKFNLIEIPAFIENIFHKNNENITETKSDDANIYDYLQNNTESGSDSSGGYVLNISLENIKDIISKIILPDNIYLEMTAKYYTDGKASKQVEMSLWKKNGKYKYTLTVNSKLEEVYINDTKREYIENDITGNKTIKNADALFNFDNIPNIPNINYYLNLLDGSQITDYKIERASGENIADIEYEIPVLNQRETIYFSLDTGIVSSVKSYVKEGDNESLYYECETYVKEAYYNGDKQGGDNTAISDSMFLIK
ncbi:MAG: hypothetical protein FWD71_08300 [Oscillospiraceae bacterium]|nr:hypothetical protein [Oscillospiraceae bacterium]